MATELRVLFLHEDAPLLERLNRLRWCRRPEGQPRWDCRWAGSLTLGGAAMRSWRPDLVLAGSRLGARQGVEMVHWIHQHRPQAAIVLMGEASEQSQVESWLEAGADFVVQRPELRRDFLSLYQVIEELLAARPAAYGRDLDPAATALRDLLYRLFLHGASGVLEVDGGNCWGKLHIDQGLLCHAVCRQQVGRPALRALLDLRNPSVTPRPSEPVTAPSLAPGSWEYLWEDPPTVERPARPETPGKQPTRRFEHLSACHPVANRD